MTTLAYRTLRACLFALSTTTLAANQAVATGNTFETAQSIELNRRYEGSLPISQGRHCYRMAVPNGKRVTIQSSNNYGVVFVSAYTGHGQLMVGETQILSSYQPNVLLQTEETDGSVMVCIDSDTAQRQKDHNYSLQVSIAGESTVAQKPTIKISPVVAAKPTGKIPTASQSVVPVAVVIRPNRPPATRIAASMIEPVSTIPVELPIMVAKQTIYQPLPVKKVPRTKAKAKKAAVLSSNVAKISRTNPLVVVAKAPDFLSYPQTKTRKSEERESSVSAYVNTPLLLAANSRSFDRTRDARLTGDTGGNFTTARYLIPDQVYSGFLNAGAGDKRDCYIYSDLPQGSRLKMAVASNGGALGVSVYGDKGSILIGQSYMVNQQGSFKTKATGGDVLVCIDTDGEKSDHQYTFSATVQP
jgi:hypothetical protein